MVFGVQSLARTLTRGILPKYSSSFQHACMLRAVRMQTLISREAKYRPNFARISRVCIRSLASAQRCVLKACARTSAGLLPRHTQHTRTTARGLHMLGFTLKTSECDVTSTRAFTYISYMFAPPALAKPCSACCCRRGVASCSGCFFSVCACVHKCKL